MTKPTSSIHRRAKSPRTRTSKRRGGFDFGLRFPSERLSLLDRFDSFKRDPFFVSMSPRPISNLSTPSPHCDTNDPLCTSSSYNSSYSCSKINGKENVKRKESFERKGKDSQGETTVENKYLDLETVDGTPTKNIFYNYVLGKDKKRGRYVDVKDPTGKVKKREYVGSKLSTKDKAAQITAIVNKHRYKLPSHLGKSSVASTTHSDDESVSIAALVRNKLNNRQSTPKRTSTRKQSSRRSKLLASQRSQSSKR